MADTEQNPHPLGTPSTLLLSSRAAGWEGLTVERHLFTPGERDTPARAEHLVCLNIGQRCDLWVSQGGRTRRVVQGRGEVLIMPSGDAGRARCAVTGEALHLLVRPTLLQRTAREMGVSRTDLVGATEMGVSRTDLVGATETDDPRLLHLGMALGEEARTGGAGGPLFAECLSTALAAHLLTSYGAAPVKEGRPAGGLSASQRERVKDYVRGNLGAALSLSEVAQVAGVSPFHFARLFKRATGETVHQFVLRSRLEAARRLLREDDLSVGQVAAAAGFAQQSHLAAHFKRATGLSPTAFRQKARTILLKPA